MRRRPRRRAPRRLGFAPVLAGCLVALLGTDASATNVLRVPVVAGPGTTQSEAARIDAALARQLDASESLRPVGEPPPPKDSLAPVLEQARALVGRDRFTQARVLLEGAVGKTLGANEAGAPATVAQAELLLGGLELRAGSERKARDAFEQAVAIEPHIRAPHGFPPLVERELDRARDHELRRQRTVIGFEGSEGTTIAIDGVSVGTLPAAGASLLPGWHRLDASGDQGTLSLWFDAEGASLHLPIAFPPGSAPPGAGLADALEDGVLTAEFQALLTERCRAASADAAVVGELWRDGSRLRLSAAAFSVERGGFVLLEPLEVDDTFRTIDAQAFHEVVTLGEALVAKAPVAKLPVSLVTGKPPSPKKPEAARPNLTPTTGVASSGAIASGAPAARAGSFFSRVPNWVWIATGAVVLVGAGGATWYAVSKANRGPTGTVSATW